MIKSIPKLAPTLIIHNLPSEKDIENPKTAPEILNFKGFPHNFFPNGADFTFLGGHLN